MRLPAVILLGFGGGAFLPLPVFLLWPLLLLAWLLVMLFLVLVPVGPVRSWLSMSRQALRAFASLPGFRVDMRSSDGPGFNLWIV